MRNRLDFAAINRAALNALPNLVTRWAPSGHFDGPEWVACNPTRDDRRPGSFKINTNSGVWSEFATGDGGSDPISLYAYLFTNDDQGEAARKLADELGVDGKPGELQEYTKRAAPVKARSDDPPLEPVPGNAPEPPAAFPTRDGNERPVVARWAYHDEAGALIGYACRIEYQEKGETIKDVICCRWIGGRWRWKSFPKPRPLYGLETLGDARNVVLVEGEKTADAARQALPSQFAVVAWPGGSKAARFVDFSPLQGCKVVLLPDADAPGFAAMEGYLDKHGNIREGALQLLEDIAAGVKVADPGDGLPEGWDVADRDWREGELLGWIKSRLRDPRPPAKKAEAEPAPQNETSDAPAEPVSGDFPPLDSYADIPPIDADYVDPADDIQADEPVDVRSDNDRPFRCLGFYKGATGIVHNYMARGSRQVISLTAGAHTKNNLLELAPLHYWEYMFPGAKAATVSWDMAINALIQQSQEAGIFDPESTRGRGAWWDNGRAAIHIGDRVILGGERYAVEDVPSDYIYELSNPLRVNLDDPLPTPEANKLVQMCELVSWEKPVNARLFAGWISCAIICGALDWRPHIWVTGGAGTGKTTVMDGIAAQALGRMGLFVQGETTEAGIRQRLQHDALPVLFDEAESERKQSAARMENVMALVTQASSDSGAAIIKGTAGGRAQTYRIRSCFAFSSIAVTMKQAAARTRVTVLGLRKNRSPGAKAQYDRLCSMITETLTDDYCERLHARIIALIPVIRKNAETFSNAGAEVLGSKRLGDQLGALLAGAWALHSSKEIDKEQARAWIAAQDWTEEKSLEETSDEASCTARIFESMVRLQSGAGPVERSVGELVAVAARVETDSAVDFEVAGEHLERMGIKVDRINRAVAISNNHNAIKRILADSPWSDSWARTLRRIEGATASEKTMRFRGASVSRAVIIPLAVLFGEQAEAF